MKNMKKLFLSAIIISSLFAINSCYHDKEELIYPNSSSCKAATDTMGPTFTNVRNIINSKCGGCHLGGGSTAGYNFDNDCSIVTYWNEIKRSCVQPYTLQRMPTSGPLSTNEQSQITAWVNAGHRYTD
jgi:uncharacterized membrane protein